jgi:hypothetical protein
VVGVHSPELPEEHDRAALERAVRRYNLDWPHLVDDDLAYWRALHNEYWPAAYLVDRCGRIRALHVGEVHADEDSGLRLEGKIEALLAEPAADCAAEH